ncbi:Rhodanese domain-containing protein [Entamoeba marina]
METIRNSLINDALKQKSFNDIKNLCKMGIPQKYRSSVYSFILQPKTNNHTLPEPTSHEAIDLLIDESISKDTIWAITDYIINRYTINYIPKYFKSIYQVVGLFAQMQHDNEVENEQSTTHLTNMVIAFYEKYHKYLLSPYPSVLSGIHSIVGMLLMYHDPQLAITIESKRLNISSITSQYMYNMCLTMPQTRNGIWKLWDFLALSEDSSMFIFVIATYLIMKGEDIIRSEKDIQSVTKEKLTDEEVDIIISTSVFIRSHTPLTFFRYLSGCTTYSYNFQRYYTTVLKENMVIPVTAIDILKDISSRRQSITFIDCRNESDYNHSAIQNSIHATLPLTTETIPELLPSIKPHSIVVLYASGNDKLLPDKDQLKCAALMLVKSNIKYVCVMDNGFEGYHECLIKQIPGACIENHSFSTCYICNPQFKRMEHVVNVVGENTKKVKETVQKQSSQFWGLLNTAFTETPKKSEPSSSSNKPLPKIPSKQLNQTIVIDDSTQKESTNEKHDINNDKKPLDSDGNGGNKKKLELLEIVDDIEEDKGSDELDDEQQSDADYFGDLIKENLSFEVQMNSDGVNKNCLVVLAPVELIVMEKNVDGMFMLVEVLYDDIKKVITKRSAPENITIKTVEEDLLLVVNTNTQQFTKELSQKIKK